MAQQQGKPDPICYEQKWFNVTQTTAGGCGVSYTNCPGRVLCDIVPVGNKTTSAIQTTQVACQTYSKGTGSWPNCTGGVLQQPPTTFVAIPYQTCYASCDSTGAGE